MNACGVRQLCTSLTDDGKGGTDSVEKLRKPLLIVAIAVSIAVVLVEVGLLRSSPGLGIRYLALVDGQLLFALLLVGTSLVVPERVWAKTQGPVTLIVGLLILLKSIALILGAVALLLLMIALIMAFPFGTFVYLVRYGDFDRGPAAGTLEVLMSLKIGFCVCLLAAHQRFLQNKGLVIIVLISLLCTMLVRLLHGIWPIFMVSILDAVAAIVVGIAAAIWALLLSLGSVPSILRAAKAI
jgi:hypothetical protein